MKLTLSNIISEAIQKGQQRGDFAEGPFPEIILEYPKEERHGDCASNIAMVMASREQRPPREIAETIIRHIEDEGKVIKRVDVAGPGFINFFLTEQYLYHMLKEADHQGERYGETDVGSGMRVLVEFLSANPTGPLHIGHGRIAAVGDVLANILDKAGYVVDREYYVNDTGTQMDLLGSSVSLRYQQEWGADVEFPPDGYQGEYIRSIASQIKEQEGDRYLRLPEKEVLTQLAHQAAAVILKWIKDDLETFRVHFDHWFSENDLYQNGLVEAALNQLKDQGYIEEADQALWFKSTLFGDEKDRVVVRASGAATYFASDIAYHKNKYDRGYDLLIDIWGADHHGYIPRMEAAIQALDFDKTKFKVILVQLVNLLRGGKPISMSTRAGEFASLREVMDEVGEDACRYFFMLRRADTPLDFDLEVAKHEGPENPVYYVQYAHARIASIFRKAEEKGITIPPCDDVNLSLLCLPQERTLIRQVVIFPEFLENLALSLEPHRLTSYLHDLAGSFHSYYNRHRVIAEATEKTYARLLLVRVVKRIITTALCLLGVRAPEEM